MAMAIMMVKAKAMAMAKLETDDSFGVPTVPTVNVSKATAGQSPIKQAAQCNGNNNGNAMSMTMEMAKQETILLVFFFNYKSILK